MARNTLKLDISGFNEMAKRYEALGGDVKAITQKALERAGAKIEKDTIEAVQKKNLPQKGKFSQGYTEQSIVRNSRVTWSGTQAEINVGFDYSKPGAGGFLITGTPKMQPDRELHKMYKQKAYMRSVQNEMIEEVQTAIAEKMEGQNGR